MIYLFSRVISIFYCTLHHALKEPALPTERQTGKKLKQCAFISVASGYKMTMFHSHIENPADCYDFPFPLHFYFTFWSSFHSIPFGLYSFSIPMSLLHCQGTSLAVGTPFIYPIYCSYFTFISLCLDICLLLFGYDLTLSCSQYTLFISLLLEPPCYLLALAALFSLYRLPTLFRVISPLSLQVALTGLKWSSMFICRRLSMSILVWCAFVSSGSIDSKLLAFAHLW